MPPIGMHISDVVVWLKDCCGLDVPVHRIRYAARTRAIPCPYKTASGDLGWAETELPLLLAYFRNPKKPGRPRKK